MSNAITKARKDLRAPVSFGGGGDSGGSSSSGPNWNGACNNFIAATNFAALGAITTAGTPMSKGFAATGVVTGVAAGFACAAAYSSGQRSAMW